MQKIFTILFSFLLIGVWQISIFANGFYASLMQAEKLFDEKLYQDALPLYCITLSSHENTEKTVREQILLRLSTCHIAQNEPEKALSLLDFVKNSDLETIQNYLRGLAYYQKKQKKEAFDSFQNCTIFPSQNVQNLIELEKTYYLIHTGDFHQAKRILEAIPFSNTEPLLFYVAQLQLSKIYLLTQQYVLAQQALMRADCNSFTNSNLFLEKKYLQGLLLVAQQEDEKAIPFFEQLLLPLFSSQANWWEQVMIQLIGSYLRKAFYLKDSLKMQKTLSLAEKNISQLLKKSPSEISLLLAADLYLLKAKLYADAEAYRKANQLLSESLFCSEEAKNWLLLKQAEGSPTYEARETAYQNILETSHASPSFYGQALRLKGCNEMQEGIKYQKEYAFSLMNKFFEKASHTFSQSLLHYVGNPMEIPKSTKYLAIAYALQMGETSLLKAWNTLSPLFKNAAIIPLLTQDVYEVGVWIALQINDENILHHMQEFLTFYKGSAILKNKLQGVLAIQLKDWGKAEESCGHLLQTPAVDEALFWLAYCAEQQQQLDKKKNFLYQLYTEYPESLHAPWAYFHFYSYREYMQGDRKIMRHLEAMASLFPHSPLLIYAYYLIGLHKKNPISKKYHSRKDCTAAIQAFQTVEELFDSFFKEKSFSSHELSYFIQIRNQSQLERAYANFMIANQSTGSKRTIYLKYTEELFMQIIQNHIHPSQTLPNYFPEHAYTSLWSEAEYALCKVYIEQKEWMKAEEIVEQSLKHYNQAQIFQGIDIMRIWYIKGAIAQQQKDPFAALQAFLKAEHALPSKNFYNPEEKLILWIQQSRCYKELENLEEAMKLLSRVVNANVISTLRLKAMFLRAEIYELQGRYELAVKQLEATANKGGEWGQKAQQKLEEFYGYSFFKSAG